MAEEKNRMEELSEKRDGTFLEKIEQEVDQDKLNEELKRLELLGINDANANLKEAQHGFVAGGTDQAGSKFGHGQGRTVNTFIEDLYQNPSTGFQSVGTPLQSEEALEVAVKRTLKSGAPVNNISFYDEVNWNLQNLGFSAKLPIDIKNVVVGLIEK